MKVTYTCPVCLYEMQEPAKDYTICSCCGTEFGYSDVTKTHMQLRAEWIAGGRKWFSNFTPDPR